MSRKLISSQPLKDDLEDLENIDFFKPREKQVTFDHPEETKERPEHHKSPLRASQVLEYPYNIKFNN